MIDLYSEATDDVASGESSSQLQTRIVGRGIRRFPRWVWYLLLAFIALLSLVRLISSLRVSCLRRRMRRAEGGKLSTIKDMEEQRARPLLRTSLQWRISQALLSFSRVLAFRTTVRVPIFGRYNVSEIVVTAVYLFVTLLWTHLQVEDQHPQTFYRFILLWSDRTGIIAASQIPFVVALAGKTNIISHSTGISYEKLNIMHQASSHVMFLMVYIHSFVWVGIDIFNIRVIHWGIFWLWTGVVATIAHTIITILGLRQIRELSYEFFLVTHIIFAFIFLLFTYFHIGYEVFDMGFAVWPAAILWVLDRLFRIFRIATISFARRLGGHRTLNATVEPLPGDTLLLTLTVPNDFWLGWEAGQSAYVTVPSVSLLVLEAHPFTIASIDAPELVRDDPRAGGISDERQEVKTMKFIIRACEGFTRRLHDYAVISCAKEGTCKLPVFVDGPYSHPPILEEYESIVLVSGGSGVAYTLPLLLKILRQADSRTTLCRRVLFIWSIRHRDHVSWIWDDLSKALESLPPNIYVSIRIHVSNPHARTSAVLAFSGESESSPLLLRSSSEFETEDTACSTEVDLHGPEVGKDLESQTALSDIGVILKEGRPNIDALLSEEILNNPGVARKAAVIVSGPGSLADSVRSTLSKRNITGFRPVLDGAPSVYLHVESFSW
ncbi:ferric reductase NAD binding domain-containing protein [Phellopilus nigrolimitatus]|nr:ferric reductase NAD binding domain-containing protein [Phellopilus nigrolimitatus]